MRCFQRFSSTCFYITLQNKQQIFTRSSTWIISVHTCRENVTALILKLVPVSLRLIFIMTRHGGGWGLRGSGLIQSGRAGAKPPSALRPGLPVLMARLRVLLPPAMFNRAAVLLTCSNQRVDCLRVQSKGS